MTRSSFNFRGIIAPVLCPFNERSLTLNLSVIPSYAKYLADRGIHGVLVNGTSGEGMSMSTSERKQLSECWITEARKMKQHLMIQVGGAPLPHVLDLAEHADGIKADSILCLPELYFKPTEPKQLIKYLRTVSEAAPNTSLLYYHMPIYSNVTINMGEFLESVSETIPNLVGIKFSIPNLAEGIHALRANSGRFNIFLGNNEVIAPACAVGFDSFIPTSANIFSDLTFKIVDAVENNNNSQARKIQDELTKAVVAISKYGHWVAAWKTAMALLTPINPGPVRIPIEPLSQENIEGMKEDLRTLGYKINS